MGRDTIQLENTVSTISHEYLLKFTFEYGIPESLYPELPDPKDPIMEFPKSKVGVYTKSFSLQTFISLFHNFYSTSLVTTKFTSYNFLLVDQKVFPTVVDWCTNAPKDEMPSADSYSAVVVATLNTRRTPIQKQPEALLCLVGLIQNYFLGDDVYPTFLYDDDRVGAPNPTKVKTRTRPRAAHEVSLLTATASRIIDMGDTAVAGDEVTTDAIPESGLEKEVASIGTVVNKRHHKRGNEGAEANAPPKVLRKDHVTSRPSQSTLRGKSLAAMGIKADSIVFAPATQETPVNAKGVSDPDPLSYAKSRPIPEQDIAQSSRKTLVAEDLDSEKSTSITSMVGSTGSIYQPGWGVTNNCCLDTPAMCQDVVDHIVPPWYFLELRHLPNDDFLSQYNINLARQVAMGSQMRLRLKQEAKLLKKAVAQVARQDQRIEAREKHIKNLEALLEAEADMKGAAKAKNVEFAKELESLRAQIMSKERIKAVFEEFKKYEDDRVNSRCVEMDARLDALSIDFDEELYPHMLTAITGRRWVIEHGLRLTVMKCSESTKLRQVFTDVVSARIAKGMSEGLKHRVEHGKAKVDLAAIEAYDPEADIKFVMALHALKDLKYPLVDQLEKLKDSPIDVIMASLFLKSDSREDAPQWICDLRPSSS
nr:hypothetical protein [Tanacetum cinerariifolium]